MKHKAKGKSVLKPMLATLVKEAFNDKEWIFEIKWDGYRVLAEKTKKVELYTRNGNNINSSFPHIVEELSKIRDQYILDGEIVVLDSKGRSSFQLIQNQKNRENAYYYVFDILFHKGKDLRDLPLLERKKILEQFFKSKQHQYVRKSDFIDTEGKALLQEAKKQGWEGIIAKKKDSSYLPRRTKTWLKIKVGMRQEVVIGGFTAPRQSRKYFGALLVGVYEKDQLVYIGHVGTGFNEKTLQSLHLQMNKLERKSCPFSQKPNPNAPITWITPKLVCEVAFTEWTEQGIMRHPSFQGMRIDKNAKEVTKETFKP